MLMEEPPAFGGRGPTSTNGFHDDSQRERARREPISTQEMDLEEDLDHRIGRERPSRSPTMDPTASSDDLGLRIVLCENRPIENLPAMVSQELKLIGRCVTFLVTQALNGAPPTSYYYIGLVSTVTASTATLMHVNRYTPADFMTYKSREQRLAKGVADPVHSGNSVGNDGGHEHNQEPMRTNNRPPLPLPESVLRSYSQANDDEVAAAEDGSLTTTRGARRLIDLKAFGSLAHLAPLRTETEIATAMSKQREEQLPDPYASLEESPGQPEARGAARHRHFRRFSGSIGPIPYMTFLRKSIENVEFGRDPSAIFYSLFQDPAKHIDDMQCLRMFVRRYLVHTSEGNNPHQVPLYAFLCVRCAWPDVDRELVNRLVHEELTALVKADCAIGKEKERKRVREERQLQRYRAPAGLFSSTGILFLTKIPQRSFFAGIITLLFSLIFAIYLGVVLGVTSDALIVSFVNKFMFSFVTSVVVWPTAAVAIMLHASKSHIPLLVDHFRLGMRIALTLAAIVCCIMTLLVVLWKMTNQAMYDIMLVYRRDQLCAFYQQHTCTGFSDACGSDRIDPNLCLSCPNMPATNSSCYASLWFEVEKALVPLLCFTCIILMATVYAAYLIVKLFLFVEVMMGRIV
ncbi:conserved hypothetical protein [Leishmania mexicana MHOM/GT/2001/U1103]|uniref:Uncharacterized protein n=1 Tax=Leishmania mexicana (strain MHOM/GT/2001/U1103) TaxID=929439 RepID=E9B1N3_LEIMU|nr:conserved hypothetical protein [Leishmania mexicana MHOM/GT/2001/U1103]CBZ29139.1 conserved hypothetical protein [Leishmania mexicana MHOM/GT/2001/U1103]